MRKNLTFCVNISVCYNRQFANGSVVDQSECRRLNKRWALLFAGREKSLTSVRGLLMFYYIPQLVGPPSQCFISVTLSRACERLAVLTDVSVQ